MGFTKEQIEVHDEATNLYGYKGDKREQTAEIVIRKKDVGSSSNDIGFKKQEDGTYQAVISEFDSARYNKKWLDDTSTHYGVEQSKRAFELNGWQYEEKTDELGRMQLIGVSF